MRHRHKQPYTTKDDLRNRLTGKPLARMIRPGGGKVSARDKLRMQEQRLKFANEANAVLFATGRAALEHLCRCWEFFDTGVHEKERMREEVGIFLEEAGVLLADEDTETVRVNWKMLTGLEDEPDGQGNGSA